MKCYVDTEKLLLIIKRRKIEYFGHTTRRDRELIMEIQSESVNTEKVVHCNGRTRLNTRFKGMDEQCGFTSGRSCLDRIFTLRLLLEKYRDKQQLIGLTFTYLEKAYVSVPRKLLRSTAYGEY